MVSSSKEGEGEKDESCTMTNDNGMRNCIAMQTSPTESQVNPCKCSSFHFMCHVNRVIDSRQKEIYCSCCGILWIGAKLHVTLIVRATIENVYGALGNVSDPFEARVPSFISVSVMSSCFEGTVSFDDSPGNEKDTSPSSSQILLVSLHLCSLTYYYSKETSSVFCAKVSGANQFGGAKCEANNSDLIRELQNSERC